MGCAYHLLQEVVSKQLSVPAQATFGSECGYTRAVLPAP